ncbi:formate dehydrogenase [Thalassotalea sp. HSM 43]|uniref:formate dehydrogenase subunit alpha n=1 Tax=Thalassotalea sp. HSM 43 TaxID=2552945 RepID=UPI0010816BD6|nr:formate dehydrogenase subunit alpha [Thalassotalea sp. HSM 43]QBY05272.1 formate dehydrogenase [Thalassotalea sp. HSM 43]
MKLTRKVAPKVDPQNHDEGMGRRQFLKSAGITATGVATAAAFAPSMMRKSQASEYVSHDVPTQVKRSICSACAVGCGIYAEVQNGVWTGQEPAFDHPISKGSHCAKGAAEREHGQGKRRVRYPLKLIDGKWQKLSWEQALSEVTDKMKSIRKQSGPDSIYFMGSAKFSNESAYLYRKLAAMWGTNNVDHSARICHSTTVAGVANTWGYGAQTNSLNDMHNAKSILLIGSNPAEAHPIAMKHILIAKERGAKIVVADPRFTRTAVHADLYCPLRPGTDIPFIYGLLWHIFDNNWQDDEFIKTRVFAMEDIREEVKNYDPDTVSDITGVDKKTLFEAAKTISENRPGGITWCMGGTQHHIGNSNTRVYCILQLALGNLGVSGGGANILRGHDNVQGATDLGVLFDTLPGYYGLTTGSWQHWSRVWGLDYEWVKGNFNQGEYLGRQPMTSPGIPCSRWHDGVLEEKKNIAQADNIRLAFFWGQSVNTETRQNEVREALDKLETIVVVDPYPTMASVLHNRKDGVYILPACTCYESYGSVTNTSRSIQWREKVIEPIFESKPDTEIMYLLSKHLGFDKQFTKNIAKTDTGILIEDITREFNKGMWTIGMSGQSPERLKYHTMHWGEFSYDDLVASSGEAKGEVYGLPWPCWGTPDIGHPGSTILYNTNLHVKDGGSNFRARFGVEYQGKSLLADGTYSKGSEIKDGYPEFSADMLKQLGWWDDLTEQEQQQAEGRNWKTDLSGGIIRVALEHGCSPYGNAKARCKVWTFPDPVPIHREPLYAPRRDLVAKYPTYEDMRVHRLPTLYRSIQEQDFTDKYPLQLSSGRLVEYEGGGEETRTNAWLAELQQEMFVEIHPTDAAARNINNWDDVWLEGAEGGRIKIKAMVTPRVREGLAWMPFHFAGFMSGENLIDKYPDGTAPYVLGESANTALTYGYDPVTQMQETKCSLCQIEKA